MLDDDADLNWYDYGFRSYDPQIGRFEQLDPLTDNYPFLTPYQYASNDPITNIDIDGLEGESAVLKGGFNLPAAGAALINDVQDLNQIFRPAMQGAKHLSNFSKIGTAGSVASKVGKIVNYIAGADASKKVGSDRPIVIITSEQRSKLYSWEHNQEWSEANEPKKQSGTWNSYLKFGTAQEETSSKAFAQQPPAQKPKNSGFFDTDKAVAALDANAGEASKHRCAYYVRIALAAGGINTSNHPANAREYGPYLKRWGFNSVQFNNYSQEKGDVRVFQPYSGGNPAGHIDMYNGSKWVSDFREQGVLPGPGYRKYPNFEIFRWGGQSP